MVVMDEGVVGGLCLGSGLMYWLMRRGILCGKVLYRWGESVVLGEFIE